MFTSSEYSNVDCVIIEIYNRNVLNITKMNINKLAVINVSSHIVNFRD